ncbi:MaoC family dehydratase N-terminal domain-containing protein [Paraburkholderia sp. IW21]|uniref:FAS1-like dehydratase domain-containing protein n=1 Tax=Paraburkholderia sp. IW21 TaxID=3242488 RepID=UPI0035207600
MGADYASAASYTRTGSGDDLPDWVGREFVIHAPFPVELSRIADFCAMLEDPNPLYWDIEAATQKFGRPIAPPATLTAWRWPAPWNPYGRPEHGFPATVEVPCPTDTLVNVEFACDYLQQIGVGDKLTYVDRIAAISDEKMTALGRGYFVTADTVVTNQENQEVAKYRNVMLRYKSGTGKAADSQKVQQPASEIVPTDSERPIPALSIPVTWTLCTQLTAATRDYFPGHHDPDYAKSQGVLNPYPNTGYYCGLMDRVALEWANFDGVLKRRVLRMFTPAPIGTTLRTSGRVLSRQTVAGTEHVELQIEVRNEEALIAQARITLKMGA